MFADADIHPQWLKRPELTLFETSEALNDLNLKQTKAGYYLKVNGFASAGASLLRHRIYLIAMKQVLFHRLW